MQKVTQLIRLITAALMGVAAGLDVALKVHQLHAVPDTRSGGADMPGLQDQTLERAAESVRGGTL